VSLAVVSQVWLDKLPPDLRKIVVDTGQAVQQKTQDWEVEFSRQLETDWKQLGGEVHTLSADDYAKMKTLLGDVGDEVTKDQPPVHDLLVKVRAIAAKH
jgi:TRAP-type C4-dicarboxylate transport system substrate-binding protein